MARHGGRKGVCAHGVADGARRRGEVRGQGGVGGPAAAGNGEEGAVDFALVGG